MRVLPDEGIVRTPTEWLEHHRPCVHSWDDDRSDSRWIFTRENIEISNCHHLSHLRQQLHIRGAHNDFDHNVTF